MFIRYHKKRGLTGIYICLFFLNACQSGNDVVNHSDSPQIHHPDSLEDGSKIIAMTDTAFISITKQNFVPYEGPVAAWVPEYDSIGKEGKLEWGNAELISKNTGRYEHVLGEYDLYDFSFLFKKELLFSKKNTFGTSYPYISPDSSWFTIQFTIDPRETDSKQALYLVDMHQRKEYMVDSMLYGPTSAPVVALGTRSFVVYIIGDVMRCYDIQTGLLREIAFVKYDGIDTEDSWVNKMYDVAIENGKLSAKVILQFGGDDPQPRYRIGSFSIPFKL